MFRTAVSTVAKALRSYAKSLMQVHIALLAGPHFLRALKGMQDEKEGKQMKVGQKYHHLLDKEKFWQAILDIIAYIQTVIAHAI